MDPRDLFVIRALEQEQVIRAGSASRLTDDRQDPRFAAMVATPAIARGQLRQLLPWQRVSGALCVATVE